MGQPTGIVCVSIAGKLYCKLRTHSGHIIPPFAPFPHFFPSIRICSPHFHEWQLCIMLSCRVTSTHHHLKLIWVVPCDIDVVSPFRIGPLFQVRDAEQLPHSFNLKLLGFVGCVFVHVSLPCSTKETTIYLNRLYLVWGSRFCSSSPC